MSTADGGLKYLTLILWGPLVALGWAAYSSVVVLLAGQSVQAGAILGLLVATPIGLVLAVLQWLGLRLWVRHAGWWAITSAAGWMLGGAVGGGAFSAGYTYVDSIETAIRVLIVGGLVGLIIGALQWLGLRLWVRQAGWWVLASAVSLGVSGLIGWIAGISIGSVIMRLGGEAAWPLALPVGIIAGAAVSGLVAGAVTAVTLALMLNRAIRATPIIR